MRYRIHKSFIPECFLDTNLIEVLLRCENEVTHRKGNSSLLKFMEDKKMVDSFLVAIIDDDKIKVKQLDNYNKIERLCNFNLKLYKHPIRNHFVIQLSPAIERWILEQCKKANINLADFGIASTLDALVDLKGQMQRSDVRYKKLFKQMLKNESCGGIIELERWLIFFRENNYNADLDLL